MSRLLRYLDKRKRKFRSGDTATYKHGADEITVRVLYVNQPIRNSTTDVTEHVRHGGRYLVEDVDTGGKSFVWENQMKKIV